MCPMCLATGVAIVAGSVTTGSLAAFAVIVTRRGRRTAGPEGAPQQGDPVPAGTVHTDARPKEEA